MKLSSTSMPYQSHPSGDEALNCSFMGCRSDTAACWQALLMPSGQAGLQGHTGYSLSCESAMCVPWLDDRGASSILRSSAVTELLTNPSLCCHPQPMLRACVCWVLQSCCDQRVGCQSTALPVSPSSLRIHLC